MDFYNALALLLVAAAAFAYLNHRFLRMPSAIGLMGLGLVASLGLVGITYVVVFSIIGQGLTIGPLVRWLGVGASAKTSRRPTHPTA